MAAPTPPSTTRPPARRTSTATGPQAPQPGLNSWPAPTRPAASGLGLEGADRAARVLAAHVDAPGHLRARAWAASSYDRYYGGDFPGPPPTPTKDSPKRSPQAMSGPGPLPPRDELTKQFTKHGSDLLIKTEDIHRAPALTVVGACATRRGPRSRTGTLAAGDASGRPQRRRVCCWRRRGNRQHRTRWQASW